MSKEKRTRATLEDLVRAKLQREQDKYVVKDIEIPSNKLIIQCRKPNRSEICDLVENINQNSSTEAIINYYEELIYHCCEILHEEELREDLSNPVQVVSEIMDENDILVVGDEIASMHPLYKTYQEETKNS